MTRVAAARGYGGASVARVSGAAGVSRATFYEHFRDRDDCFLAAYFAAAEALESRFQSNEGDDPCGSLSALLEFAEEDRSRARTLLVESLAGPHDLRARHWAAVELAERRARRDAARELLLPPDALHGGVVSVVSAALLGGSSPSPRTLLPQLRAWVDSYAAPPGAAAWSKERWLDLGRRIAATAPSKDPEPRPLGLDGTPQRRLLPRGRSAAPAAVSAADRRRRILDATAELVAQRGYAAAGVADIAAAARVTRSAFYSHFRSKEDAFLAALVRGLQESAAAAASEYFVPEGWPARVWCGLAGLLGYLSTHPQATHLGMVEIYAAGEAAIRRAQEQRLAFTLFLADGYRENERAAALPALCSEAIGGAIEAMLRRLLLNGKGHRALELLPQCAYVALAPFIGVEAARDFVVANSTGARPAGSRVGPPVPGRPAAGGIALLGDRG